MPQAELWTSGAASRSAPWTDFVQKLLSCGFLGGGGSSHVKPRGGSEAPSLFLLSGKLHPWIYYCRIFKYTRPYIQLTPSVGATALALLSL